jgi:chemotaxis signal transduction protein
MDRIDYLLLRINGAPFSIPLSLVLPVTESAPATAAPYAPTFVRGIVVVGDRILSLISMAQVLGLTEHTNGPLAIAAVGDDARALEVGAVVAMVAVEAAAIHVVDEQKRSHPLLGQYFAHNGEEWLVIDYVRFIRETAMEPEGRVDDAALIPVESIDAGTTGEDEDAAIVDHKAYLLVTVAGDTYALSTADVAELLMPAPSDSCPARHPMCEDSLSGATRHCWRCRRPSSSGARCAPRKPAASPSSSKPSGAALFSHRRSGAGYCARLRRHDVRA